MHNIIWKWISSTCNHNFWRKEEVFLNKSESLATMILSKPIELVYHRKYSGNSPIFQVLPGRKSEARQKKCQYLTNVSKLSSSCGLEHPSGSSMIKSLEGLVEGREKWLTLFLPWLGFVPRPWVLWLWSWSSCSSEEEKEKHHVKDCDFTAPIVDHKRNQIPRILAIGTRCWLVGLLALYSHLITWCIIIFLWASSPPVQSEFGRRGFRVCTSKTPPPFQRTEYFQMNNNNSSFFFLWLFFFCNPPFVDGLP